MAVLLLLAIAPRAFSVDHPWDTWHVYFPSVPDIPEPDNDRDDDKQKDADPILSAEGNYVYPHTDLWIKGRNPALKIRRVYDSMYAWYLGPFGYGWSFIYDITFTKVYRSTKVGGGRAAGEPDKQQDTKTASFWGGLDGVIIRMPEGKSIFFKWNGGVFEPPAGSKYTLDNELILKHKDGIYYKFQGSDDVRKVSFIGNAYGEALTLTYDNGGKLIKVADRFNRFINISYNLNNKISSVSDFTGRSCSYDYDDEGNLIAYTNPCGYKTFYAYNAEHRIISVSNQSGHVWLSNTYNQWGKVIQQIHLGGVYTFEYDTMNKRTTVTYPNGGQWIKKWDDSRRNVESTDPYGFKTVREWDDFSNAATITNKRGFVTNYEYEGANLVRIINAAGAIWTATYTPEGKISTFTSQEGAEMAWDYDDKGNIVKIKDTISNETQFIWNDIGRIQSIIRDNGDTTNITYNELGYIEKMEDSSGRTYHLEHDGVGNLLKTTNPLGHTRKFEYDPMGRITAFINPMNQRKTFSYNQNGRITSITDPLNKKWIYEYDNYNRLIRILNPLGDATTFGYDASGNMTLIRDAEGGVFSYEYDLMNRVKSITDQRGGKVEYQYNAMGSLEKITDARGNNTSVIYDSIERVISTVFADATKEEFTYGSGRVPLTQKLRNNTTISYQHDPLGRLIKRIMPDGEVWDLAYDCCTLSPSRVEKPGSVVTLLRDPDFRVIEADMNGVKVKYEYDVLGRRTKLIYPDNTFITYEYDAAGKVTKIRPQGGAPVVSYEYDGAGRRTRAIMANDTQIDYVYDAIGRIVSVVNRRTTSGALLWTFAYTYDRVGNRKIVTTSEGIHRFTYDALNQIISAERPEGFPFADESFTYDPMGNRLTSQSGVDAVNWTANNMNRYTQAGALNFNYDVAGNMTSDGSTTFAFNPDNLMISAVAVDAKTYTSNYDVLMRRYETNFDGVKTRYIYDFENVIAEYDEGGALKARYIHGTLTDEVVRMTRGGVDYYYHYDALGSVVGLTNSLGEVVEAYKYDAFGKPQAPSSVQNPHLFAGARYDAPLGLYYNRARHYSPALGRFMQEEPIPLMLRLIPGNEATFNIYHYVLNNPQLFRDPSGYSYHIKMVGDDFYHYEVVDDKEDAPGESGDNEGASEKPEDKQKDCRGNCMNGCMGKRTAESQNLFDKMSPMFSAVECIEGAADFAAGGVVGMLGGCAAGAAIPGLSDAGVQAGEFGAGIINHRSCEVECEMGCLFGGEF